ncbi:nucleoside hydrolase [Neorhizobium galegae]|uniref:nucleoside hydrolase n=1 Tax=Neorhizobium galegae TaxID=399 RepID=UPI00351CCE02
MTAIPAPMMRWHASSARPTRPLDMIALTCVACNVGLEPVVNNARRVLELCGRQDIPVYSGAARPIMASRGRVSIMHGADGLAGTRCLSRQCRWRMGMRQTRFPALPARRGGCISAPPAR